MANSAAVSTIAIDGPAGSGKSTIGMALAEALGHVFFDSGVLYRAVTYVALERGLDLADEEAIRSLAESLRIDVRPPSIRDGRTSDLVADGSDLTWKVRTPEVDSAVSAVAALPGVREAINRHLRRIGAAGRIVMVGRDIGTVVLPDADLKVYLEASPEERARRRYREREARGEPADYDEILASIRIRDAHDSSRETAPLQRAPDARRIDSDGLTISEVLARVLTLVHQQKNLV